MRQYHALRTASLLTCLVTVPALAHGGGDGMDLSIGFYYGHDGTYEAPANPAEPATLLVDTHPWELDTVYYALEPTSSSSVIFDGWTSSYPAFTTLSVADEEYGGHGYYSWLNADHNVMSPDIELHLVEATQGLTIINSSDYGEVTVDNSFNIGVDTANHHLIYYVEDTGSYGIGDVLTATFYLSDNNGNLADSQNFTLQFEVVPEPTSAMLLGLGGLMAIRRRR